MRVNRFYTDRVNLRINSSVKLPDSDIKHIRKVLRLSKGDKVIVFNGVEEYLGELNLVTKDFVTVRLTKLLARNDSKVEKVEVTLFQGLLKAGKFDLIVEKTTELGINYIVPTECEFSQNRIESATSKLERLNKVAIAASKQSERIEISQVLKPITFLELVEHKNEFDLILFFTIPRSETSESLKSENLDRSMFENKRKIAIIIGPEGGFSPREHKAAFENEFKFVKVGDTILRSETAAIVSTALVRFLSK